MTKQTGLSNNYYQAEVKVPTSASLPPYVVECNDICDVLNMRKPVADIFKAAWRSSAKEQGGGKESAHLLYDAEKMIFFALDNLRHLLVADGLSHEEVNLKLQEVLGKLDRTEALMMYTEKGGYKTVTIPASDVEFNAGTMKLRDGLTIIKETTPPEPYD